MQNSTFRRSGMGRKKLMAEINVVPYIDVTLVLLIIFMVTAPIVQQAVSVDLPQTPMIKKQSSSETQTPFVITVTKDGLYKTSEAPGTILNQRELAPLIAEVIARSQLHKGQPIYIQGDRAAPYGKVVHLFTLLKANGVENVSLLTEPESGKG